MRTQQQIKRIASMMTGIVGDDMAARDWIMRHTEEGIERHFIAMDEAQEKLLQQLSTGWTPVAVESSYSIDDKIDMMKDMVLTYQKYCCDDIILTQAIARLAQLEKDKRSGAV